MQRVSAANSPALVLTVESSNGAVAEIEMDGSTGASVSVDMPVNEFQFSLVLIPLTAGVSTVSVSFDGFVAVTASEVDITVSEP
jgi:hypothetical protein